jgi:predicted RNA-binding protein with RPS1 domain
MNNDPWEGDIPGRYRPGEVKKGKVTKLTNFGVFVELEPGLEGLLHISELADHKVESPEDVVKVGDEIEVKILRVDAADRKIGLSRKRLGWSKEEGEEAEEAATPTPARPQRELRGGTGASTGQLINMPEPPGEKKSPVTCGCKGREMSPSPALLRAGSVRSLSAGWAGIKELEAQGLQPLGLGRNANERTSAINLQGGCAGYAGGMGKTEGRGRRGWRGWFSPAGARPAQRGRRGGDLSRGRSRPDDMFRGRRNLTPPPEGWV